MLSQKIAALFALMVFASQGVIGRPYPNLLAEGDSLGEDILGDLPVHLREVTPVTPPGPFTPPEGPVTPPAGPVIPPVGPVIPPVGPVIPPTGPVTPPAAPVVPPAGQVVSPI